MGSKWLALGAVCVAAMAMGGAVTAQTRGDIPDTGLAPGLMTAAASFESYTRGASEIDAGFASAPSVAGALSRGAAYEPHQFETGMIAWAALAAMQDPQFVDGVRAAGGERGPGGDLGAALLANPYGVMTLDGADHATLVAATALAGRGAKLTATGRSVKQSAYDVQHSAWSKTTVAAPAERLAHVKALSAQPFEAAPGDVSGLLHSAADIRGAGYGDGVTATPILVRALALAAEAILGEAGDADRMTVLTAAEPGQDSCLKMAKLNLYQCLAVAGPQYEDIFCLGQHALIDTGGCIGKAAGGASPPPIQTAMH